MIQTWEIPSTVLNPGGKCHEHLPWLPNLSCSILRRSERISASFWPLWWFLQKWGTYSVQDRGLCILCLSQDVTNIVWFHLFLLLTIVSSSWLVNNFTFFTHWCKQTSRRNREALEFRRCNNIFCKSIRSLFAFNNSNYSVLLYLILIRVFININKCWHPWDIQLCGSGQICQYWLK